jgi:uncharacterized membrane protein YeaQ/YmgE (transglycosylase-associated protein family)
VTQAREQHARRKATLRFRSRVTVTSAAERAAAPSRSARRTRRRSALKANLQALLPGVATRRHRNVRWTLRKMQLRRPVGLIVSPSCRLVAGALARLLVPGKQDIFIPMTILLGVIGLLVGGLLGYLVSRKDSQGGGLCRPSGIIGSVTRRGHRVADLDESPGRPSNHPGLIPMTVAKPSSSHRVKARAGRGLPAIARGRGKHRR